MEIEDFNLQDLNDIYMLKKIFTDLSGADINLNKILDNIKKQIKSTEKYSYQKYINFFMFLTSKYSPKNNKSWNQAFHNQINKLQKYTIAKNYHNKKIVRMIFRSLCLKKKNIKIKKQRNLIMKTQVSNNGFNNTNSIEFYSFRSQKNIVHRIKTEVCIKAVDFDIRLKSRAFYCWIKYLKHRHEKSLLRQKNIIDLKRSLQLYHLNLKVKSIFQWKKYLTIHQIQNKKAEQIRYKYQKNHKQSIFKIFMDTYMIIKIQNTLQKKVLALRFSIAKIKTLKKLKQFKNTAKQFQGYSSYYGYLFIKWMIQKSVGNELSYNENTLKIQLKCGRSQRKSINNQLMKLDKQLKVRVFGVLVKNLKKCIISRKQKQHEIKQLYFNSLAYQIQKQKQLKIKRQKCLVLNKKYQFKDLKNKLMNRKQEKQWFNEEVDRCQSILKKILIKKLFVNFKKVNSLQIVYQTKISQISKFKNKLFKQKALNNLFKWKKQSINLKIVAKTIIQSYQIKQIHFFIFQLKKYKNSKLDSLNKFKISLNHYHIKLKHKSFISLALYKKNNQQINLRLKYFQNKYRNIKIQKILKNWKCIILKFKTNNQKIERFKLNSLKKYLFVMKQSLNKMYQQINSVQTYYGSNLLKKYFHKFKYDFQMENRVLDILNLKKIYQNKNIIISRLKNKLLFKNSNNQLLTTIKKKYAGITLANLKICKLKNKNQYKNKQRYILLKNPLKCCLFNMRTQCTMRSKQKKIIKWLKNKLKYKFFDFTKNIKFILRERNKSLSNQTYIIDNIKMKALIQLKQQWLVKSKLEIIRYNTIFLSKKKQEKFIKEFYTKLSIMLNLKKCRGNLSKKIKLNKLKNLSNKFTLLKSIRLKIYQKTKPIQNILKQKNKVYIIQALKIHHTNRKRSIQKFISVFKKIINKTSSLALYEIFQQFSFISRLSAVITYIKKQAIKKFVQTSIRNSNYKSKIYHSLKYYAKKLLKKGFSSLVIANSSNYNQQNSNIVFQQIVQQKSYNKIRHRKLTEPQQRKIQKYFNRSLLR